MGIELRISPARRSVSRAIAPACLSLSKLSGVEEDPPVTCIPRSLSAAPITVRVVRAASPWSEDRKGAASPAIAVFQ